MTDVPPIEALSTSPGIRAWPLQSHLRMAAVAVSVPWARHHVRAVLDRWNLDHHTDVAELVVCELVTNAIRASQGMIQTVRLWLCSDHNALVIQVWDSSDRMPVRQDPGLDDMDGRGLLLVESVSSGWGAYRQHDLSGKIVWAIITQDVKG